MFGLSIGARVMEVVATLIFLCLLARPKIKLEKSIKIKRKNSGKAWLSDNVGLFRVPDTPNHPKLRSQKSRRSEIRSKDVDLRKCYHL